MGSWASTGAGLYYTGCEDHLYESHFLQSCSLCNKPLGFNSDIFMYRGDTPFCSKECRQEQIEMDEARERRKMVKSSNNSSSKRMTPSSPSSSATSSSARSSRKSDAVAVA